MLRTKLFTCLFTIYTVLFVIPFVTYAQNVNISDPNLKTAIAETLGKASEEPITEADMEMLVNLTANDKDIKELIGLELAINLQALNLENNVIDDISPLSELTQLNNINLGGNAITDISALAGKIALLSLSIQNNLISDLKPLSGLINLQGLNISNNLVTDLSPIANLKRLVNITMSNNPPADLAPMVGLISLRNFHSWGTRIINLSALAKYSKLRTIDICGGEISDLTPLEGIIGLRVLNLVNNDIENITPLAGLTGLTRLSLKQNMVKDVRPLIELHNLTFIDLDSNEILDFSPLNVLSNQGTTIIRTNNPGFISDAPKIVGPWLWVIVSTEGMSGSEAAKSEIDFLAQVSDDTITEEMVATQGAVQGASVGNKVWKAGKLSQRGGNNINELVNAIGLGIDDINHHVAYGSIILNSPEQKQSKMFVGSGDAVKIWLNGELVHENHVDRDANDYQDDFNVTLKKGDNFLLVAVYEGKGWWSGFFGLDPATKYETHLPGYKNVIVSHPADVNGDGKVNIFDMIDVARYFGLLKPHTSVMDVNSDGNIDIKDLIHVAQHIGSEADTVESAALSPAMVKKWITLAWEVYDGSIEFRKGITNLENLLTTLTSEKKNNIAEKKTVLFANYPNPFNPETWIPYQLAVPADVVLTIYSVKGSIVRTLVLGHQSEGEYKTRNRAAHWDGKNDVGKPVASGIYFYTLTAGDFTATRKMVIKK